MTALVMGAPNSHVVWRAWLVLVLRGLPQAALSRAWGALARWRRPRVFVRWLIRAFVRLAHIDLSEAALPLPAYATLEDLFVRRLKAGARPIDPDPAALVSPVDAIFGASGAVTGGTLLQVKGRTYPLAELLGNEVEAKRYEGGAYVTLYLSPRHYHRIHAPIAGDITDATLIPGRLLPVFPEALAQVDHLFSTNERLVTYIDHAQAGRLAVVKIGATLVGRISVSYDPTVWTNHDSRRRLRHLRYTPSRRLDKGDELAAFELGSTVVLVTEPGRAHFIDLREGSAIHMGARLGLLRMAARAGGRGQVG